MTAQIKYTDEQYAIARAIVESYESQNDHLWVRVKLQGNALALVLEKKRENPKRSKQWIVNKLLSELHQQKTKK